MHLRVYTTSEPGKKNGQRRCCKSMLKRWRKRLWKMHLPRWRPVLFLQRKLPVCLLKWLRVYLLIYFLSSFSALFSCFLHSWSPVGWPKISRPPTPTSKFIEIRVVKRRHWTESGVKAKSTATWTNFFFFVIVPTVGQKTASAVLHQRRATGRPRRLILVSAVAILEADYSSVIKDR